MDVLKVTNLSRSFGAIKAVRDVSFALEKGEMLAMIGPNGAGKSTCFNMMMGQLRASSGTVSLHGEDITGLSPRDIWRKGVGRTFQVTATYQSMTVVENIQVALLSHNKRIFSFLPYARTLYRDEALGYLEIVGMREQADRHCAVLAYGDLKRLELAIALCHEPSLLLMDEPTAGMAPKERHELMSLTSEIVAQREISVLFTEHDMDIVFGHAHRVLVLNRGELIASGSVTDIRGNTEVQEIYLGGGTLYKAEGEDASA